MRLPSPPRIVVVSREDKEAKLRDFIATALAARRDSALQSFGEAFTLVARAPDSPVAQAVLAMSAEIAAANIAIRVVFFETEPMSEDVVQASLLDVSGVELRMLTDLRFAAAHEQLVLGREQVWIGDCMRRDPMKRDAFEMYHEAQRRHRRPRERLVRQTLGKVDAASPRRRRQRHGQRDDCRPAGR